MSVENKRDQRLFHSSTESLRKSLNKNGGKTKGNTCITFPSYEQTVVPKLWEFVEPAFQEDKIIPR